MLTLLCTVRDCARPLVQAGNTLVCPRAHSFDRTRRGFVNLLQPQDKKSLSPGDSVEVARARRRLFERGVGLSIATQIATLVAGHLVEPTEESVIVDVGCGEGTYLQAIASETPARLCGIDISRPAIDLAAARAPQHTWVICNADRILPLPDASVSLILSITARLNPDDFSRTLRPDGSVLVALPAADDLHELRRGIQREAADLTRVDRAVERMGAAFTLRSMWTFREVSHLDTDGLSDLALTTYRGARHQERSRLQELPAMPVTSSRDVLLFRRA